MNVSVIIPVYNSEGFLQDLFKCLDCCEFENNDEILLVDNGSTDCSTEMCKQKVLEMPGRYKYLYFDEKADSYATRNFGVKNANNEVLIFTDSDCKPQVGWVKAIKDNIKENTIVGGKIQLEIIENTVWEHFDSIAHLKNEEVERNHSVATANMSVFKDDFFKVGYFTERFSGGDHEWSQRAVEYGMDILYRSDALVHHPSRKTFGEILKKEQRIAYGEGKAAKLTGKNFFCIVLRYCLKVLKIDTNIRYSRELRKREFTVKQIVEFNIKFFKIRFSQIQYVIRGYKGENTRNLKLK